MSLTKSKTACYIAKSTCQGTRRKADTKYVLKTNDCPATNMDCVEVCAGRSGPGGTCCKALRADCLACNAGLAVDEYCRSHSSTNGCSTNKRALLFGSVPLEKEDVSTGRSGYESGLSAWARCKCASQRSA